MKWLKYNRLIIIILGLLLGNASTTKATIMDPAAMGNRSLGMGAAMVGLADDTMSALYYNPAGIVQLKKPTIAMGSILPINHIRYKGKGPYQGYSRVNSSLSLIPFFGYTHPINDRLSWGLGMYSTLGIGFKYRKDHDHGITHDFQNNSGVMALNPTFAYQIHPKLALGGQINIGFGKSQIDIPTPAGYLKNNSEGFGYGGTLGILYKPFDSVGIGIRWKSSMLTPLEGDVDLFTPDGKKLDDSVDLDLYWPQMVDAGISYKPTSKLTLVAKIKWSDWSYFGRSKFTYNKLKHLDGPLIPDIRDGIRWGVGMEYLLTPEVTLYSGYFHDYWSIESSSLSPLAPGLTLRELRVGTALNLGNWTAGMAYSYTFFPDRHSSEAFPGKYEGFMPVMSIEMTYNFQ